MAYNIAYNSPSIFLSLRKVNEVKAVSAGNLFFSNYCTSLQYTLKIKKVKFSIFTQFISL
jgi:hypothetical protein